MKEVTFDIIEDGMQSQCPQVIEYSVIYRYIAFQGVYHERYVSQPITQKSVHCDEELSHLHDIDRGSQDITKQELLQIGLGLED